MLIDDDIPMLKFLSKIVDWNKLGLEVIYESASSMKALEVFDEVKPDIIVTDIGLPKMDGIELISRVKEMDNSVRVIFLTCHEEFHYAKKAIKLNVDDYIVKEELTKEQLEESLKKSINKIKEIGIEDEPFFKENLIRNNELLKRTFINELTKEQTKEQTYNYLKEHITRLNLPWKEQYYKLAIGYLPPSMNVEASSNISKLDKVYDAITNLSEDYKGIGVFINGNHLILIMNYRKSIKFNDQLFFNEFLVNSINYCKEKTDLNVSFITFKDDFKLDELGSNYKQIINEKYRFFYDVSNSIDNIALKADYSFIPLGNLLEYKKRELLKAVEDNDFSETEKILAKMYKLIIENKIEPIEIINDFINMVSLMEMRSNNLDKEESFTKELLGSWSMKDVMTLLKNRLVTLAKQTQAGIPSTSDASKIQLIDEYIAKNITENISSVDVAKYLFLNPSYFSRYFRRLTGFTFTDYVYQYKMKTACNYLLHSDESIEVIGLRIGFTERTYFSKVFKKYIGVTPSEFRSNQKAI